MPNQKMTNRYDEVVYPSYTHPQTHPDRLATIGTLFGLKPADISHCRVLELGCGNGSNLLPMAANLPHSEFVGIDLAVQPIQHGQQAIDEIGLKNIHLINGSLTELNDSKGRFDYIIAHGLFSWVPVQVREHVFRICRQLLQPQGIAFISYNALPGARLRNMVREMMLFHVQSIEDPRERIRQAKAVARFVAGAQDTADEYRLWMKAELESILNHEEGHLFHDELADISDPYYFTQFIQKANEHGLKYLGEADYFEMFDHGFNAETREVLKQLGQSRILREQYLDFLKCRRFRQTLLCHQDASLTPAPEAQHVCRLFISSTAKKVQNNSNLDLGTASHYVTPKGARITTDSPLGQAALAILADREFHPISFKDLLFQAQAKLSNLGQGVENHRSEGEVLQAFLLELYAAGIVDFRTWLPPLAQEVKPKPKVSPLVRWQVKQGNCVTSQFHMGIKIEDEMGKHLLATLDGTLDQDAILEKLATRPELTSGSLPQPSAQAATRDRIKIELQENLAKLNQLGLLIS